MKGLQIKLYSLMAIVTELSENILTKFNTKEWHKIPTVGANLQLVVGGHFVFQAGATKISSTTHYHRFVISQ